MCRLPHKLRKGLCLTPKQLFRLMRQGPFLLCLCQRGAFTAFQMIFIFAVPLSRKRKAVYDRLSINVTSRHPQQANREEKFYLPTPTRLAGQIKPYFLTGGLPGFTLPAMFFFCWGLPVFSDFSFEVFCLICLYFRLPPFLRLSVSRIRQSFPFWAQR